ncbi:MAG: AmmeMemoRadiSam system protein B [Patescibacteria group bacterium]
MKRKDFTILVKAGMLMTAAILVAVLGWKLLFVFPRQTRLSDDLRYSRDLFRSQYRENGNTVLDAFNPASSDTAIVTSYTNDEIIQTRDFYDEVNFQNAFQKKSTTKIKGFVIAGLVNHHALAQTLIVEFFASLKSINQKIDRVVIISPDHNKAGRGSITTHLRPYATPDGPVYVDTSFVELLVERNLLVVDNGTMFEKEHGVGALVPFIHHEFPSALIVPFAVRGNAMKDELLNFGRALSRLVDQNTIIIISSDMSHYLPTEQALKNDKVTLDWLKTLNFSELAKADDDYLDNGAAMAVLDGVFLEQKIKPTFLSIDHSISTKYGADPSNTTSYITGVWTRPAE